MGTFFHPAEKAAATQKSSKALVDLLDDIRADEKLSTAAHWDDDNKVRDGILVKAPEEMIKYASQYKVGEHELKEKTVEMMNATGKIFQIVKAPYVQYSTCCSLLHWRCSASTETNQDRLLLYALLQLLYHLHRLHGSPVD